MFHTFKAPGRRSGGRSEDFNNLEQAYREVYEAIEKKEDPVVAERGGNARLITLLEKVGYEPYNTVPGEKKGMLEENTIIEINSLKPILFPGDPAPDPDQKEPVMTPEEAAMMGGKKTKKHKKRKTKKRKSKKRTSKKRKSIKRR